MITEEQNRLFEEVYNKSHGIMTEQENLQENIQLQEMAVFRKKESGLPVNLYFDDSGTWKNTGHWKRIKIQPDKGDHPNTRNMIPMSISDDPKILVDNPNIRLSNSEVGQIKSFVANNVELLLNLEDVGMKYFYDNVKL